MLSHYPGLTQTETGNPMTKLNGRTVSMTEPALPEGKTDYTYFDEDIPGLGLRIRKGGAKGESRVWVFHYWRDGRGRKMTLGKYPKLMAQGARDMVQRKLAPEVALGHDPADEKFERRTDKETFGETVAAYLQAKQSELRPRTFTEAERYLSEAAKGLHGRELAAVSQADIALLLNRASAGGHNATANRLRANLAALFTWAAKQGKVKDNPVSKTEKRKEQARDRVLTDAELAAIWNALPDSDYGRIVKLLMLTGQRRDEIGGLRWAEIDLSGEGFIHLPKERTKNKRPHMVPLSPPARAILAALQEQAGDREFVFGRGQGFAGWSASKAALDSALTFTNWTLHDLRRTAATGMARLGVNLPVIERALNHISDSFSGIVGVYQHHPFNGERREALDKWAAHVVALVSKRPFAVVANAA
jgi:integrase